MTNPLILQYRGISWVSRLIRWQTRSCYSHSAVMLRDGSVVEAWHRGGVLRSDYDTNHTPGTVVDVFTIEAPLAANQMESFLLDQLHLKYDWRGVLRFLTRRGPHPNRRWFCSELVAAAARAGGVHLLHLAPEMVSPRDIGASAMLKYSHSMTVGTAGQYPVKLNEA